MPQSNKYILDLSNYGYKQNDTDNMSFWTLVEDSIYNININFDFDTKHYIYNSENQINFEVQIIRGHAMETKSKCINTWFDVFCPDALCSSINEFTISISAHMNYKYNVLSYNKIFHYDAELMCSNCNCTFLCQLHMRVTKMNV